MERARGPAARNANLSVRLESEHIMPGPVSDSYDPEFSTGANAHDVREAIKDVVAKLERTALKGKPVENIVEVVHRPGSAVCNLQLTEREWRIIRFSLNRATESI